MRVGVKSTHGTRRCVRALRTTTGYQVAPRYHSSVRCGFESDGIHVRTTGQHRKVTSACVGRSVGGVPLGCQVFRAGYTYFNAFPYSTAMRARELAETLGAFQHATQMSNVTPAASTLHFAHANSHLHMYST